MSLPQLIQRLQTYLRRAFKSSVPAGAAALLAFAGCAPSKKYVKLEANTYEKIVNAGAAWETHAKELEKTLVNVQNELEATKFNLGEYEKIYSSTVRKQNDALINAQQGKGK